MGFIMFQHLDLFSGLLGFHTAGKATGRINTFFTSEIDSYNCKLIDRNFGFDNAGDINHVCLSENNHPYKAMIEESIIVKDGVVDHASEIVPSERTGFSSLCIEDFMEGVLPFPDLITGSFPCQDISPAFLQKTKGKGIKGERSGLVHEQLRIIEELEPKYAVFENSSALKSAGLDVILRELSRMGYICEWSTVAAAAFGYPHYRHRLYLIAYLPTTAVAKANGRIFNQVRKSAVPHGYFKIPRQGEDDEFMIDFATIKQPRSVKLRTKRINSLGNAIIPDIAKAIFDAIFWYEDGNTDAVEQMAPKAFDVSVQGCFELTKNAFTAKLPTQGYMSGDSIYTDSTIDPILNPSNKAFSGMFSTLIAKDGNNNFTSKSRTSRPGKLGGLIGDLISLGACEGGLNPEFAEWYMGYEAGHTKLKY